MRLLADENFPGDVVSALQSHGHDVAWVLRIAPGVSDQEVMVMARQQGRLIVTFDKDFGELVFRSRIPAPSGVILFRLRATSPQLTTVTAVSALATSEDWEGNFSIVEEDRIRRTPLPEAGP